MRALSRYARGRARAQDHVLLFIFIGNFLSNKKQKETRNSSHPACPVVDTQGNGEPGRLHLLLASPTMSAGTKALQSSKQRTSGSFKRLSLSKQWDEVCLD